MWSIHKAHTTFSDMIDTHGSHHIQSYDRYTRLIPHLVIWPIHTANITLRHIHAKPIHGWETAQGSLWMSHTQSVKSACYPQPTSAAIHQVTDGVKKLEFECPWSSPQLEGTIKAPLHVQRRAHNLSDRTINSFWEQSKSTWDEEGVKRRGKNLLDHNSFWERSR